MQITLEIPEELAALLGGSPQELSRHAMEAVVLEAYRRQQVSGQLGAQLLGLSRLQWEDFLFEHNVLEDAYTIEDLERDVETMRQLRLEGKLRPV